MGGRREASNSEKTRSEASGGGEEGEGRKTRAAAEGERAVGAVREGLERVSASMFSGPGTWTMELVKSARQGRWRCWLRTNVETDTLNKA